MKSKHRNATEINAVGASARSAWGVPATLVVIAGIVRIVFYMQLRATPFFENLFSDSRLYLDIAKSLGSNTIAGNAVFMSPIYPWFLALVNGITGDVFVWARVLQMGAGVFSVWLVYATGVRLFNRTAGFVAGLIVALFPVFILYDASLMIEPLLGFIIAAHTYTLVRAVQEDDLRWFGVAGLFLGLMGAMRGSLLLFLLIGSIYLLSRKTGGGLKWKHTAVYAGATLPVIILVIAVNSGRAGEFVPITSSGGLNFYAGNNSASNGMYTVPERFDTYKDPGGMVYAERIVGKPLSPMEVADFWQEKAWGWIAENPGAFLGLLAQKAVFFFNPIEVQQIGMSVAFFRKEFRTVLDVLYMPFILIFLLALAGSILAWRKSGAVSAVLLFCLSYYGSTVLFFVNGRLRAPLVMVLALFAGYAVAVLIQMVAKKSFQKLSVPFGVAAGVVIVLSFIQPDYTQTFELEYSRLGDVAFAAGDFSAAEQYFSKSIEEKLTMINMTNFGNALAAQKKFADAEHAYEEAIRLDETYAPAFYNKGNMAHQRGKYEVAYRYWSKTIALDPQFVPAYRNLGLLLMQAGRLPEARERLERYVSLETSEHAKNEIRRDIHTIDELLRRNQSEK